jgi:hypothetical protein
MDIVDQFLNDRGKWMIDFNTEDEYQKQINRVRQSIRETIKDNDFDVLVDYFQLLRRSYVNMLMEKERAEYFNSIV